MKELKRLILVMVAAYLISSSATICNKNIQASRIIRSFNSAITENNYEEAAAIKNEADNNILTEKLYSFSQKAESIAKNEYESIKQEYLQDNTSYTDLLLKIKQLEEIKVFSVPADDKQMLKNTEDSRSKYRDCEELFTQGNYKEALNGLNEIENTIDNKYKEKVQGLSQRISDELKADLEIKLNEYIDNNKYDEALALLNSNKDIVSAETYNEKLKKIDHLTNKIKVVKNKSSKTKFLVWVDISTQTTNIFTGSKGNWKLIKSFACSTGVDGEETPRGTFTIKDRGAWFFSEKYQQGGKFWVRIFDNYLFHSIPMDEDKNVVDSTLGTAASHGCIRQSIEDSAWFYDNIPSTTTVYIN